MIFFELAFIILLFYFLWNIIWKPTLAVMIQNEIEKLKKQVEVVSLKDEIIKKQEFKEYILLRLDLLQKLSKDIDMFWFIIRSKNDDSDNQSKQRSKNDKFSEEEHEEIDKLIKKCIRLITWQVLFSNVFSAVILAIILPLVFFGLLLLGLLEFVLSRAESGFRVAFFRFVENLRGNLLHGAFMGLIFLSPTFAKMGTNINGDLSMYEKVIHSK